MKVTIKQGLSLLLVLVGLVVLPMPVQCGLAGEVSTAGDTAIGGGNLTAGDTFAKVGTDALVGDSGIGGANGATILGSNTEAPTPLPDQMGPGPAMMLLLGSGLIGTAAWGRKKFKR